MIFDPLNEGSYEAPLLVICYHPDKSCDHKHCNSGDVFNLSRGPS